MQLSAANFLDAVKLTLAGGFAGTVFGTLSDMVGDEIVEIAMGSGKARVSLPEEMAEVGIRSVVSVSAYIVMDRVMRAMQGARPDITDNMAATFAFYGSQQHWMNSLLRVVDRLRLHSDMKPLQPSHINGGSGGSGSKYKPAPTPVPVPRHLQHPYSPGPVIGQGPKYRPGPIIGGALGSPCGMAGGCGM